MTTAFTGADAVVSCLGVRTSARALLRPVTFQQRMLPTVLAAINDARVPRFVLMSSFGIADTRGKASFLPRVVFGAVAKNLFEDKALAETALDGCQANWTAVYPVSLRNGPVAHGWDLLPLDQVHAVPGVPVLTFHTVAQVLIQLASDASHPAEKLLLTTVGGWR